MASQIKPDKRKNLQNIIDRITEPTRVKAVAELAGVSDPTALHAMKASGMVSSGGKPGSSGMGFYTHPEAEPEFAESVKATEREQREAAVLREEAEDIRREVADRTREAAKERATETEHARKLEQNLAKLRDAEHARLGQAEERLFGDRLREAASTSPSYETGTATQSQAEQLLASRRVPEVEEREFIDNKDSWTISVPGYLTERAKEMGLSIELRVWRA